MFNFKQIIFSNCQFRQKHEPSLNENKVVAQPNKSKSVGHMLSKT